ncbi:MAG: ATP-dependent helicase [Actinobacteria bacterium]|nr:ATP-dependent helicase [Actinomycetota bacterium]MBM3709670.1 ATP-dependent helicase [Actinomycetota bacterium]
MSTRKEEKKKAKRKIKQKERRYRPVRALLQEKADFLFYQALLFKNRRQFGKSLSYLEKVLHLDPKNEEYLQEMGHLGYLMKRQDIEINALLGLYNYDLIKPNQLQPLCQMLEENGKYKQALSIIQKTLKNFSKIKMRGKKTLREFLIENQQYCKNQLESIQKSVAIKSSIEALKGENRQKVPKKIISSIKNTDTPSDFTDDKPIKKIPIYFQIDPVSFKESMADSRTGSLENYQLTLRGYQIRFKETFESLICLNSLKNVRSFWFQEETARKILKTFHGRALLADEVGLGKTIEALMVLKEYIQRGMVKSALILTPTPLVSQWKEELKVKFGLNFPSTDDPGYNTHEKTFWKEDFILASINLAKSKKNFPIVTQREYDIVIVDEAHHLKDRNTLNWKLVNTLKKRFLLLLTATPVENNLMELYNLVTLLKPGQLKTASSFREKFMTRGDPTDPQNSSHLKDLLGQIMIRNTRAFAKVDIPPRFAQTIKVEPVSLEIRLYQNITALIKDISKTNGSGHKLLLKNLLTEAGSSPRSVGLTLSKILAGQEILVEHKKMLLAINNLCRSITITGKDKLLFKLLKSYPGKMILFVKYLGTLEHVSEFLASKGISHSLFHGKMDNQSKDEQIQNFKEEKDILLTTEIGGEGRNLQFCHQMINYDLPWNPMKIEQRIGRIHRIGQEKEVMIFNLCAAESVEDYILEILDKKINMFEMVIGEIDMILGRIEGEKEFSETVYDIWVNSRTEEEKKAAFGQLESRLIKAKTSYQKSKELDKKLFGENYEL